MPVIMLVSAFAALVSMGGAPRASIFMGKGDPESAERTLGNRELQRRLALDRRDGGDPGTLTRVYGATDAVQQGESVIAPEIRLGDATLDNLEVTFADLPVFRVWKLEQVPAMLIGMDLLGVVAQLNVDYRRAELQIRHRRR